jgi:NAD(P)-dependent dehydrogenase (short-subunit alcohol dehydrogenase family)
LIEPQEIADVILFLASEESKMITGQNILVD